MKSVGVKICGVTRVEDAVLAVELGAQYVGLNFWPRSPRYLTLAKARPLVEAVAGKALLVGVWVDPSRDQVRAIASELDLDLYQFHGDKEPESVDWFPGRVIKALQVGPDLAEIDLDDYPGAWGYLFDCAPAGVFGGTGKAWSYERIADLDSAKPVLLAGGLSPENVAAAILESRANIVDVCSGVEAESGIKDPDLLARFFSEVRNVQT